MTLPDAHTALLLAIDPIVQAWTEGQSPCGHPMGMEYFTKTVRLSEAVRDLGWNGAFALPETQRLVRNIGGAA